MSDTCDEDLKRMCESIKDDLEELVYGMRFDVENARIVDPDASNEENGFEEGEEIDWDDTDKFQDLYSYLNDNYGVKVMTDLRKETVYYTEICMAWGGPNIYIDTGEQAVCGYWGCGRYQAYLSNKAIDEINEVVEDWFGCYR